MGRGGRGGGPPPLMGGRDMDGDMDGPDGMMRNSESPDRGPPGRGGFSKISVVQSLCIWTPIFQKKD